MHVLFQKLTRLELQLVQQPSFTCSESGKSSHSTRYYLKNQKLLGSIHYREADFVISLGNYMTSEAQYTVIE